MSDDADSLSVLDQRLINEIEIELLGLFAWGPLQRDLNLSPDVRSAALINAVEQFDEPLADYLRKGFNNGFPDDVTIADEMQIGLIGELEHMVGTTQNREKRRSLFENGA